MTIDEAIKHAEEVAEEQSELYGLCPATDYGCDGYGHCKSMAYEHEGCLKCAKDHHQLANYLKELKAVRKAWTQLTSTVIEIRDNALNADVEKIGRFLVNYLSVLEKGIIKEVE